MFFRNPLVKRSVAGFMSAWMVMLHAPWALAAEEEKVDLSAIGKEATAFGKELNESALQNKPSFDGTNLTFQAGGQTVTINKDELAPPAGNGLRYSTTQEDFDKQSQLFGSEEDFTTAADETKESRYQDSVSESPSLEGIVYSMLSEFSLSDKMDVSNEDFLNKTEDLINDIDNVIKDIATCTTESSLNNKVETVHVREEKVCQQVLDRSDDCTVYHNYSTSVIEHYAGPYNLQSCGEGCMEMWIGKVGDDYWSGWCTIYEQYTQVKVINPKAIIKATFEYAKWDDYMLVYTGKLGSETLIWSGPNDFRTNPNYFPPETGGSCELSTSWSRNPNVDVTSLFRDVDDNSIINFKIRVSVAGEGEGYGRIRILYDPNQAVRNDVWEPNTCIQSATGITDGFAKGSISCTRMPEIVNGCAVIDGVTVCEDDFQASPIEGISPFCQQVQVKADFDFYKGDTGCWYALTGFDEKTGEPIYEEVCGGENLGGNLDTCQKYVDQGCDFVSSECTPDMTGKSGTCYVNDVVYDCGVDKVISTPVEETTTKCEGLACLNEECIDVERTESTDFAQVNALLNAAQQMTQDMTCTGLDENGNPTGDENISCQVFKGTPGYCKVAVGGWVDCCENPSGGPGMHEYLMVLFQASRIHSQLEGLSAALSLGQVGIGEFGSVVGVNGEFIPQLAQDFIGSYHEMWLDVTNSETMGWISKPFTSVLDNIKTAFSEFFDPIKVVYDKIKTELTNAVKSLFSKIAENLGLGQAAGSAGATAGADAAANTAANAGAEMMAGLATVMSAVAIAYLVYQIADLVINMVYACEDIEYETISKNDTKCCHRVGTWCDQKVLGMCTVKKTGYCCYQSPLARIINEQVRNNHPDLVQGGWGDPEHPNCAGISTDDINKIDWDRIDLSEWIELLQVNGISKDVTVIDEDTLTGNASWFDTDGTRLDAVERTQNKVADIDVTETREYAARCLNLDLGGGVTAGGICNESFEPITGNGMECRFEDQILDCHEVRVLAALNKLQGGNKGSSDFVSEGYKCYVNGKMVDCSSMIDDDTSYEEALGKYAQSLGGTTYAGKYICVDQSGGFTSGVCQAAMRQNTCSGLPGNFMCLEGNTKVPCSVLGKIDGMQCN